MAGHWCLTKWRICRSRPRARFCALCRIEGFVRPGGDRQREVDVRIITTTNRHLTAEMSAGRFAKISITASMWCRCRCRHWPNIETDIPELVAYFMVEAAREAGLPTRTIDEDAMAVMQTADWPGDVRQLRNAVEWMLIMAPGERRGCDRDQGPPTGAHRQCRKTDGSKSQWSAGFHAIA